MQTGAQDFSGDTLFAGLVAYLLLGEADAGPKFAAEPFHEILVVVETERGDARGRE